MDYTNLLAPLVILAAVLNTGSGQESTPVVATRETTRLQYASTDLIRQQQPPLDCSYRTLDRRLRHAVFSMIVEVKRLPDKENDAFQHVQVRHVIKASNEVTIDEGDLLQIPFDGNEEQGSFALVFCAFDPSKRLGITEIQWIGKDEVSYYSQLAEFVVDERRVWFLLETEASDNRQVSLDARAELEAMAAADIKRAAGKRLRGFVLQRLGAPTLDSSQRHFYLMLLGHAGMVEDVNLLAQYIFQNPDGDLSYLWTATEAYLRLGDAAAKKRFIDHFFTAPLPPASSEPERIAQGQWLLPPYLAMLKVAPELERQAKVGEYLINYPVLPDLVFSTALAKGEQRFVTLAIDTFDRKDVSLLVRREAVIYAAGMLELDKARQDRERIETFLGLVSSSDPKLHQQALDSLKRRRVFFEWTQ